MSVSDEIWASWQEFRGSDKQKQKSEIARANKMSEPTGPGSGPVRHTAGSRSAMKHFEVMTEELGHEPSALELYSRFHCTKADKNVMVDKRAQDMRDMIAQKIASASQRLTEEDPISSTADIDETQMFLDIEGVNKKKQVYGLGSASSIYVDSTASTARPSTSHSHRDEELDRRVQAGVNEKWEQMQADLGVRMSELVRAEVAKLIPTLLPTPSRSGDDDDIVAP